MKYAGAAPAYSCQAPGLLHQPTGENIRLLPEQGEVLLAAASGHSDLLNAGLIPMSHLDEQLISGILQQCEQHARNKQQGGQYGRHLGRCIEQGQQSDGEGEYQAYAGRPQQLFCQAGLSGLDIHYFGERILLPLDPEPISADIKIR